MTKTLTEQQIRKIIENGTRKAAKACEKKFYGKLKSYTEQWREGTLENGFYYVMSGWSTSIEIRYLGEGFFEGNIKVLAPVPSYNEYNKLRKLPLKCLQLEEDNSALMVINKDMCKEVERLQEQLKEANEILKSIIPMDIWQDGAKVLDYLIKWGVK